MKFTEIRSAVRLAKQQPSAKNKRIAMRLLKEMTAHITSLEVVEDFSGRNLARKARVRLSHNQRLEHRQARTQICTTYLKSEVEPSYKSPRCAISLEIRDGETPEQAYIRSKEERLSL
tara:strand:+ start:152 stop:505 length:354 start_codon:yes stop_codon:yes gene_type:complete